MDIARIFELVNGAMQKVISLAQQGKDISGTVKLVQDIVSKRPEDVTDADVAAMEAGLDADQDDFEKPLSRKV